MEVHVSAYEVIRIDFPEGGWLDENHIQHTKIDGNSDASLQDDKGRIWKIHMK